MARESNLVNNPPLDETGRRAGIPRQAKSIGARR